MFTHKDIEFKSIFVLHCLENRSIKVSNGELLLEEKTEKGTYKTLTKFPFQKILAIFIVGHISITTPLIEKCKQFNISLVVMKFNLRPVFIWANGAEANFLLHQKQYAFHKDDLSFAAKIISNKISNQKSLLQKTRKKDELTISAIKNCKNALQAISTVSDYNQLMGIEGTVAKSFFKAYYQNYQWTSRCPRIKNDPINAILDIGYTILFNFMEVFIRIFGFDPYIGVYHRLWFKRKSLVCDLIEPFRCLIDFQVYKSLNLGQFSTKDFKCIKEEYALKFEKYQEYYQIFYLILTEHKIDFFKFIQNYYRSFMKEDASYFLPFDI